MVPVYSYFRGCDREERCIACLQVHHKDVRTCAKEVDECSHLRLAYYNCKRGQVDARTRIAGNKHAS